MLKCSFVWHYQKVGVASEGRWEPFIAIPFEQDFRQAKTGTMPPKT